MTTLKKYFILLTALIALPVLAHEGHDDAIKPINQQQAVTRSDAALAGLVKNKEVEALWQASLRQATKIEKIKGARIWVTSYAKPAASSSKEERLYVFLDELGNYIDANKTGKLLD
jgi:hypothetical protein